ncbi:hypothetical protein TruAng_005067 [Truncatella angustata]|nr:hypothetical protein TruAng_005067 [Truncatella angustata]
MKYTALLSIFMFGSATIGLPNELLRDGEDTRESEQNSSARIPASEASLGIGVVSKSQRGEIAYLQRRFDILECWDAHKDDDWGQWECNGIKFFREQPYPYGLSPSHCWNEANRGIRRALADVGERTWQTECCTSLNIPVKPKTWVPRRRWYREKDTSKQSDRLASTQIRYTEML